MNNNIINNWYEDEGQFPVDFDVLWEWLGYSAKGKAVETLKSNFIESIDFFTLTEKSTGGRPAVKYYLTIDAAKAFCMMAGTEQGKRVRMYFLEVEKRFKAMTKALTPAQLLLQQAQQLVDIEQRQLNLENEVKLLKASVDTSDDYVTIKAYAAVKKIKINLTSSKKLGKQATGLCKELGYEIGRVNDERYGQVNSYPLEIVEQVFDEYLA